MLFTLLRLQELVNFTCICVLYAYMHIKGADAHM